MATIDELNRALSAYGVSKVRVLNESATAFRVESASGRGGYRVTYTGHGDMDPDYGGLWQCECPAANHGRHCHHIDAVSHAVGLLHP